MILPINFIENLKSLSQRLLTRLATTLAPEGSCEKIGCAANPAAPSPLAPLPQMGARGKKKIQLTLSPPLGERVAEGRVRGRDSIFSHLQGGEGVNCDVYLPLVPKRGRGASREWNAFPSTDENLKQLHSQRGFSLMEVLVGVAILGIVYATLFGLMSTSLRNITRIREREKMVRSAQMKMNELLLGLQRVDSAQIVSGRFDEKYSWQANIEPIDTGEEASHANSYALAKIRLAVTWPGTGGRNHYALETLKWVPQSAESQP